MQPKTVAPKDRKYGVALYSFPSVVHGKPPLSPEDDEVEFVTQANNISLEAALKLARMVNAGKLDVSCGFDQKGANAFSIGRCLDGFYRGLASRFATRLWSAGIKSKVR